MMERIGIARKDKPSGALMGFLSPVRLLVCGTLFCGSCSFDTVFTSPSPKPSQPPPARQLEYLVSTGPEGKSCRVEIRIRAWPQGDAKIFQAPVFYADNPVMPAPGYHAADLTVLDAKGGPLQARDTVLPGVDLDGNFIVLPASARSFSYAVDLAPRDSARFGLPTPGTAPGVDLIDGAYFFILPLLGRDPPAQWRTRTGINLEFLPAAGRVLVGTDAKLTLSTNYELMFIRAAYDPVKAKTFPMRDHEVTVYTTSAADLDLDAFGILLEKCIRVVEDSILPLPTYRYFVGENPQFWGIEGIQGYWFKQKALELAEVHVHELTHTFVGVYHSDHEDPWWKEGMTNYIGLLLSLQAGLIGDTAFAGSVLTLRDTLPAVKQYPLSSPFLRTHLFATMDSAFVEPAVPEDYIGLVYGKGSQAAMILDRYILERTGGTRSVYDLVRDLIGPFRAGGSERAAGPGAPGFRRSDLVASVDRLTGRHSAAFLAGLLDGTGPMGADSLASTYAALRSLKRFAPGGGKAPINGIDPPEGAAAKAAGEAAPIRSRGPGGVIPAGSKL